MKAIICTIIFLILITYPMPAQASREIHSISFPAISADGKTVYFSAWGDIWSAPRDGSHAAIRLTDNVANEARPIPSPDGKTLAFVSDRWGNLDIFVMPSEGGAATRLTWDSKIDYPYDWNSDGTKILAYTMRQDLWETCAYEVPIDGGPATRITGPDYDDHVFCSYLGNDEKIVFTRGPGDWARKGHKGQNTYDLWTYNRKTQKHEQITNRPGNDMWPQPSPNGDKIYYVRDTDGVRNIWVMDVTTKKETQLTNFKTDGPIWPRISSDGDEIAFEVFGDLYIISTNGGKAEKVPIRFPDDSKHEMVLETDFANRISEYAISPNGNYYAVVVLGDIFILKNPDKYKEEEKPDQDLSRTYHVVSSPGREMHIDWHPKSTKLAYVSDRDGQFDVYTIDLITLEEKRITNTPQDEWYPDFAPHGEKIAYYSGNRKLMLYTFDDDKHALLREGQLRNGPFCLGFEWSPDGKWIALVEAVVDSLADIFIINTEDKSIVNVSVTPDNDGSPSWSPDGKYLAYHTDFEDSTNVMLLELDPEEKKFDTAILFPDDLPKKEEEKPKEEKKEEAKVEDSSKTEEKQPDKEKIEEPKEQEVKKEEAKEEKKEEEVKPVTINFDRIHLRARPIVKMAGNAYSPRFAPTSDYLIFKFDDAGASSSWWSYTIEKEEFQNLTDATSKDYPMWSPDGKRLHFLSNESIVYLDMNGAKSAGQGSLRTVSTMMYDQYQMWDQMLFEGWRHLRDTFYDRNLHGVDWDEVLKRYRPRVKDCGTIDEYSTLYRQMLGELNASHLSYYPKDNDREAPPDNTGELGVIYDEKYDGPGWKVKRIVEDSPAYQPGSRLYESDVILKINNHEIAINDERAFLMRNLVDRPVKLVVLNDERIINAENPDETVTLVGEPVYKEREVTIKPINYNTFRPMLYEQWVMDNRKIVEEKSKGQIGYLHIENMYEGPLAKFRRELFGEYRDKKALIIDVRFNSGGYIAVDIVDLLDRRPAHIHQHRDSRQGTRPPLTWKGPIVILIDAHSFSNAEILGHIMRDLGMATIIGESTGGGVISTYTFQLMDGSTFRMPSWLNARLNGTNMELNGVIPDIFVHIDPHQIREGKDNQIDVAIDYLLKEISKGGD